MLRELTIENVAVIERASLRFGEGLLVLTGETGAGKSIIIDAINAVLGERTGRDVVRAGQPHAKVTAYFDSLSPAAKAVLESFELEPDDELLISRTISADGKSSCKIGGKTVTAAKLKKKPVKVKAVTVRKAEGQVTYRRGKITCAKKLKKSAKAKIKVSSKTGKITLKKGLKKGKYIVAVKVAASGNDYYKAGKKTVKVKITVKYRRDAGC